MVATSYPPRGPTPVKARPVRWYLAPLAAIAGLIVPRRMGPHLAASSWWAAGLVLTLTALGIGSIVVWTVAEGRAVLEGCVSYFGEIERESASFEGLAAQLGQSGLAETWRQLPRVAWNTYPRVLIVLPAACALGWVIMPWAAAGEDRRRAFLRSVKLVMWCSPAALGFWLADLAQWTGIFAYVDWRYTDGAVAGVSFLAAAWFMSVLMRIGDRYGGPAHGPLYRPSQLQCDSCGYRLTHLSTTGRCPECGRPVAESLPQSRQPPLYAASMKRRVKPFALLATVALTCLPRRFGRSMAVYAARDQARRFVLSLGLLVGAAAYLVAYTGLLAYDFEVLPREDVTVHWDVFGPNGHIRDPLTAGGQWPGNKLGAVARTAKSLFVPRGGDWEIDYPGVGSALYALAPAGAATLAYWLIVVTTMWVVTFGGIVHTERRSAVVCYASAWIALTTCVALVAVMVSLNFGLRTEQLDVVVCTLRGHAVPLEHVLYGGPVAIAILGVLWFPFHVWRMMHATRYANR